MSGAIAAIAAELEAAYASTSQVAPFTTRIDGFGVPEAYDVLALLHANRVAAGWRPLGRKIGFTNVTIWERYGVDRPMWSHVWDRTVHRAAGGVVQLPLAGLMEPRIEPEIVFGLRDAPPDGDDPDALLDTIEWIAPGFEIVHSVYPGWRFGAADCAAALGLHGTLGVGEPVAVTGRNRDLLARELPRFGVELRQGEAVVERGRGSNVLGSPLRALLHLRNVLASQPQFPRLAPGEIVTTGTLTDAWPVSAGQRWRADYSALGVAALEARLV